MLPYLNIGPLALPTPAFTLLIAIWLGLSVAEKHAKRFKVNPETLYNLAFYALMATLLGARLMYALAHLEAFIASPKSLISINFGLLDPWGGLAVGVVTAFVYGQRKGLPLWPTLDALTPAFAIALIGVHLSNYFSGVGYGAETNLGWAVQYGGAMRHPVQMYEAITAGLILWAVWPTRQDKKLPPGALSLQFAIFSSLALIFFEAFRGTSLITVANLRTAQLAAWAILAASLWALGKRPVSAK